MTYRRISYSSVVIATAIGMIAVSSCSNRTTEEQRTADVTPPTTFAYADISEGVALSPTDEDSLVESALYFFPSTEETLEIGELAGLESRGIALSTTAIRGFDAVVLIGPAPGCNVVPEVAISASTISVADPVIRNDANLDWNCEAIYAIGAIGLNWTEPLDASDFQLQYDR